MQYESNDCEMFRVFLNTLDVDTLTRALHRVIVVLKLIYHDILRDSVTGGRMSQLSSM